MKKFYYISTRLLGLSIHLFVYLQGVDGLPEKMTSLLKLAVEVPPVARVAITIGLGAGGLIVLIGALFCLARAARRQEKLHLSNPLPPGASKKQGNLNHGFHGSEK